MNVKTFEYFNHLKKMKKQTETNQSKGSIYMQWVTGILVNSTFLTYGLQSGWISPMTKVLKSDQSPTGIPLTDAELSWLASMPSLTATLTVAIYSLIVDKFGRKMTVIIITAFQMISWIIKLCPSTTTSLIIARIFMGIGAGGIFNIIPIYVKEISQDSIRGTLGFIMALAQYLGVLIMYAMGAYLNYYAIIWIALAVPVLSLILMIVAPESPTFLVKIGKYEEATSTVAKLRGLKTSDKEVQNEIELIKKEDDAFKAIPNISFWTIFKVDVWRRAFIIMMALVTVHGCNGSLTVVNYVSTIFELSGVTINPEVQALSIPIFMTIASVCSMFLVDKLGRKPILATTFILSAISFAGLASILLILGYGGTVPGWSPVLTIVVAMCCYTAGILPLPFVIISEIFNFQIKAKLSGCIGTLAWSCSFIQLFFYGVVTNAFGAHVTFYLFAVINLIGAIISLVLLPETKGKNVEEIEEILKRK